MNGPRRRFLLAAGALAASPLAVAQSPTKASRLAILSPNKYPTPQYIADNPFSNRLRALGWIEGENLAVERVYAEGREDRLATLAEEVARKPVDVIWALGPEAALAAQRATRSIPIVFWGVSYPVEQGLVASLSRPGGNMTGIAFITGAELHAKRLEILRDVAPRAKRVAALAVTSATRDVAGKQTPMRREAVRGAAQKLGFEAREFGVATPEEVRAALAAIADWRADALIMGAAFVTWRERHRIAAFVARNRLPSVHGGCEYVEAGGLVSYGPYMPRTFERAAEYVDKVLRGANAAEQAVELPSDYEICVNLKTAVAIGVTLPQSLLLRATKVFE
ncbi:MAG TPA: ABC transporter substrate-binding protein [Burkholderiales bacterium]|nr:ABC transporter substrate-binding protein [Burkholderiales bacterium]